MAVSLPLNVFGLVETCHCATQFFQLSICVLVNTNTAAHHQFVFAEMGMHGG